MGLETVPVGLRDMIPRFPAIDGGKLKGAMDESVKVCQIQPFPKGTKLVAMSVVNQCIGGTDEVRVR
jgi:hypothetical protein